MHPAPHEKQQIYRMWKKAFAFDDGGSIDDYFANHFQERYCFIKKKKDTIIATLCAHPHTMHLYGKQLPVIFISGVITDEAYRGQGHMKALFHDMFEATHPHTALYALQAYQPKIYHSLGFQMYYFEDVRAIDAKKEDQYPLEEIVDANAMAEVAQIWLSQMDGWLDHDAQWFAQRKMAAAAMGAKIYGIYDAHMLCAFAFVDVRAETWYIEEVFALDNLWQQRLFAALQAMHPSLVLRYATKDHTKKGCLMLAMGNQDLIKTILQKEYFDVPTLLQNSDKTLYHVGYW